MAEADIIDPRQREAAAYLLSAIDLPAPISVWARQATQAASVCPGFKADQAAINSRRVSLERAQAIITQLLKEAS